MEHFTVVIHEQLIPIKVESFDPIRWKANTEHETLNRYLDNDKSIQDNVHNQIKQLILKRKEIYTNAYQTAY